MIAGRKWPARPLDLASSCTSSSERDYQRSRFAFERRAFWLEQRGNEEWMPIQFDRPYFACLIVSGRSQWAGDKRRLEFRI